MDTDRKLSDADIKALASETIRQFKNEFFSDLGIGVWQLIKRGFILILLAVACYGAWHNAH